MEEKKDYKLYLDTATLAGKLMLQNGAEIYRVEDTIQRMLTVSGLKTAEAYVTATGIMVTLDDPKEDSMTVIKRIPSRGTDLNTLWRRESTVCSSFWPFVFPNGSRLTPLWRRCSPPCFWRREQWS